MHRGCDAQCGACAWPHRYRLARSRQALRPCDLEYRAPRRTGLPHRFQSVACAGVEGPMILTPGAVPLASWRAIANGEAFSLDSAAMPAVAASAAAVDQIVAEGKAV